MFCLCLSWSPEKLIILFILLFHCCYLMYSGACSKPSIRPDESMIVLSDFPSDISASLSSDSSFVPSESSDESHDDPSNSPPISPPPSPPPPPPPPVSLIVKVPLGSVSLPKSKPSATPSPPVSVAIKGKRPLALSHFATTKKRAINDTTAEDSPGLLKPPLALKLTKSPTGNSWHSVQLQDCSPSLPTPPAPPPAAGKLTLGNKTQKKRSPQKGKSASPVKSLSLSCIDLPSERRRAHADARLLIENHLLMEDDVSSVTSNSSLISNSSNTNSNGHSVITTSTPLASTASQPMTSAKFTNSNKLQCQSRGKRGKGFKRRYHKRNNERPLGIKDVKSTICFEKLFGSFAPDLVISKGELEPVHTLSLKNVSVVPSNHPVHSWSIGKPVPSLKKANRHKNNNNNLPPPPQSTTGPISTITPPL